MFSSSHVTVIEHLTTKLIVYSQGGQGHEAAAKVIAARDPTSTALINITTDEWLSFQYLSKLPGIGVFISWLGLSDKINVNHGLEGTKTWDEAQKNGDILKLKELIAQQPLANTVFKYSFYEKIRKFLAKYPHLKKVTSTQPLAILAMCKIINEHNKNNHTDIQFEIILTDLLTNQAIHFLESLTQINPSEFKHLKIIIDVGPVFVPKSHPTLFDLHQKVKTYCPNLYQGEYGLHANIEIVFSDGPIHQAYLNIKKEISTHGALSVRKRYKNKTIELQWLKVSALLQPFCETKRETEWQSDQHYIRNHLRVPMDARITTLMLGSQASIPGTLAVIAAETKLLIESNDQSTPHWIFVFCGKDRHPGSLFEQVSMLSINYAKQYKNLIIVPLTFQQLHSIAHLYTVSDLIIIRAGGMSIMEVLSLIQILRVANVKILIYAQAYNEVDKNNPKRSLVMWEGGNAADLIQMLKRHDVQGEVTNATTYEKIRKDSFKTKSNIPINQCNVS